MSFIISKLITEGKEIRNSANKDYVKIGEWTAYSILTIENNYKIINGVKNSWK